MPEPVVTETKTAPPGNWYDSYGLAAEDAAVVAKYKDVGEAVKSIPAAQRFISTAVTLPKTTATPKERAESVRGIMGRLGAFDSPDKYLQIATEKMPKELKGIIPDAELKKLAEKAHATGMLPEHFTEGIEERYQMLMEQVEADVKFRDAGEQQLDQVWGRDKETKKANAVLLARHYDDTLFAEDNKKLSPEELAEKGGKLTQLLREINLPDLWRVFADLHRVLLAEGNMGGHTTPPAEKGAWDQMYAKARQMWPELGEATWRKYANEKTGATA